MAPAVGRSWVARSLGLALTHLAVASALLGAVEMVLVASGGGGPVWVLLLFIVVGWVYIAAGLLA